MAIKLGISRKVIPKQFVALLIHIHKGRRVSCFINRTCCVLGRVEAPSQGLRLFNADKPLILTRDSHDEI